LFEFIEATILASFKDAPEKERAQSDGPYRNQSQEQE
jgi:hypothetical protein